MSSTHGLVTSSGHTLAASSVPDTQSAVAGRAGLDRPFASDSSRLAGPDGSRLAYTQQALNSRDARTSGPVASRQRAVRATAADSAASGVTSAAVGSCRAAGACVCVRACSVQRGLAGCGHRQQQQRDEGSRTEAAASQPASQ